MTKERLTHNYTNEIELKSLAIREKNKKLNTGTLDLELNDEIDLKIKEYVKNKNVDLKNEIIKLSEQVQISDKAHSRFGQIILLMIKKILTKPNFSGYSYIDDFYSDACYRVLKYIHNFDHQLKSKITNQGVSCFSYITQIIHNSIVAIINEKNKNAAEIEKYISLHNESYDITNDSSRVSTYDLNKERISIHKKIDELSFDKIKEILISLPSDIQDVYIEYPKEYTISLDDYNEYKEIFKKYNHININLGKSKC